MTAEKKWERIQFKMVNSRFYCNFFINEVRYECIEDPNFFWEKTSDKVCVDVVNATMTLNNRNFRVLIFHNDQDIKEIEVKVHVYTKGKV